MDSLDTFPCIRDPAFVTSFAYSYGLIDDHALKGSNNLKISN
jgi:hypothetical protein